MKKHLLILFFLLCITAMSGQSALRKAEVHYRDLAYTEAAKEYEDYLEKEKNPKSEIIIHAAESYYYIGNTGSALRWYEKVIGQAEVDQKVFGHYIQALRSEERYDKADEALLKSLTAKGDTLLINRFTKQKQYLDSINKKPPRYKAEGLAINTDKADFGTAFFGKKIVYASAKDTVRDGGKTYAWNKQPYLSLYMADRNDDGSLKNEKPFLNNAQTDYHNAAAAFSPNFKTVYVSVNNVNKSKRLQDDKEGTNNIQLVYGQVKGERLDKKQLAAFNSAAYSTGQPSVSPDGKWLYFVSDMPGGFGATDIYKCDIYSDGKLGTPQNLGPTVNTTGREMFPVVTGSTLYFASDGHYGLGGLDVFSSAIKGEGEFSLPQNMGRGINTNRDDFDFIWDTDGSYGYLSSNRAGGKGDDDIYYVTPAEQPCDKVVKGTVTNSKGHMPIAAAAVTATDVDTNEAVTVQTAADGTYELRLPCKTHAITVVKPGYTFGNSTSDTNSDPDAFITNFELQAYADLVVKQDSIEKIAINPIYFDFDQYYITPQAAAELDKVVFVMNNFPDIVIKIESHTDSRGDDDYNLRLSDDRAKSTFSYIMSKGIAPARIESVHGYGETRLLNKCSNGVPCTDEEHQLNRRSDFIIVKK